MVWNQVLSMRHCQKLVERQHLQNFIELFQGLKCKATDKGIIVVSGTWQPTLT